RVAVGASRARPGDRVRSLPHRHTVGARALRRRRRRRGRARRRRALAPRRKARIGATRLALLGRCRRAERGAGAYGSHSERRAANGGLAAASEGSAMSVAIVTDSAAALPARIAHELSIEVVPMWLTIDGTAVREG